MRKFIIDRNTWLRGSGVEESSLLRKDGMMCCLGQISIQCGIKEQDILGKACPSYLSGEGVGDLFPEPLRPIRYCKDSPLASLMMVENDKIGYDENDMELHPELDGEQEYPDSIREETLKKMCSIQGIELEFIN